MSDPKLCESCGMPMRETSDYGGGRMDNRYCVHCTDQTGALKPYDEVLAGMQAFAVKMMGVSGDEALKMAREGMAKMPAWQNIASS
jgi:hypothetical protein